MARATAMATRCCSPPDSSDGYRRALSGIWSASSNFRRPFPAFRFARAGDGLGQLNVIPHVQVGHQVAAGGLPHEPDLPTPVHHQLAIADIQQVALADPDTARRWTFQPRQDVQQRRFARSAGAHYADELPGRDGQINTAQRNHFQVGRLCRS